MPSTCVIDITSADLANLRPSTVGERATAWQTIVHADIITLPTIPIDLVAAPGSGKLLIVTRAVCILDTLAGAYATINADAYFAIWYDGAAAGATSALANSAADSNTSLSDAGFGTALKRLFMLPSPFLNVLPTSGYVDVDYNDLSALENKKVSAFLYNGGSGNLTSGNAANTLKIKLHYLVVDLP